MKPSQIPEFIGTSLSAGCGFAIVIEAAVQWTGIFRYAPVASTTISLTVLAVAAGVLIAGWSIASKDKSPTSQSGR